jgi:DNA-binding GntR family transcriptional regulator
MSNPMNDPVLAAAPGRTTLPHEVRDTLRNLIVQGKLAPLARLNERELCERLGVSRTPLREATRMLAAEGLVELLPNRGARVAGLDRENIRQTLEVMGALEALAAALACAVATDDAIAAIRTLHKQMVADFRRGDLAAYFSRNQAIHLAMVAASGNAVLAASYRVLNDRVRRVRYMANLSKARWKAAVREHEEMLAALEARDGPRLQELVRDHLAHKLAVVTAALVL